MFVSDKLFISTPLDGALKISNFLTCLYIKVPEVNYLFRAESVRIFLLKKYSSPPLEIVWRPHPILVYGNVHILWTHYGAKINNNNKNKRSFLPLCKIFTLIEHVEGSLMEGMVIATSLIMYNILYIYIKKHSFNEH